ncbi:MAG: cyclic nucleotide-binding domain-containing protein [Myxococcaceae bacterium]|nr:cyclic nucleotide-binding domain-containing protein [Myxococcaceae bacterium]
MADHLPPLAPREVRTRVAMPVQPPVLKPSLIPYDVMQEVERQTRPTADQEPSTSPLEMPDDLPIFTEIDADPEVAIFALSQVRLFKDLPVESIEALAQGAKQLEIPDGEFLFLEGDEARSFYVVVEGTIELLRQKDGREVALRHANRGESLGLFGLFSAQLRAASSRAIGDCVLIEVSGERLQELLDSDDVLHERVLQMHRERLLESFMASRLFNDIDSIARARLIGRFRNRTLQANEQLMAPGEVTNLVAVVTHGSLVLEERARPGEQPRSFEVTPGQFLAVTAAMTGVPGRLRVLSPEFATLAVLSHKDLNELLHDYPALRTLPQRLPAFARALDKTVFCGAVGVPGL